MINDPTIGPVLSHLVSYLFGVGVGYIIWRRPVVKALNKVKAERLEKIKEYVLKRVGQKMGHTIGSAIVYYKRYSPEMFIDITDDDLMKLATEMGKEDAEKELC